MWTIQRMDEMDDGDEERLPGEPMMTAVTLESDLGEILQFQMPHNCCLCRDYKKEKSGLRTSRRRIQKR